MYVYLWTCNVTLYIACVWVVTLIKLMYSWQGFSMIVRHATYTHSKNTQESYKLLACILMKYSTIHHLCSQIASLQKLFDKLHKIYASMLHTNVKFTASCVPYIKFAVRAWFSDIRISTSLTAVMLVCTQLMDKFSSQCWQANIL